VSIDPIGAQLPVGTPAKTQAERAAYGFERMLLQQLTTQLAKSATGDDEQASAATKQYTDMLPGVLADAMIAGGGIGLAAGLAKELPS
jgi:Rod binding domain-containing protein